MQETTNDIPDSTIITNDPVTIINNVTHLIRPPLQPVYRNGALIHDSSTIVIRCNIGHIHKYYLSDIIKTGDCSKCVTCCVKNKFANMVRSVLEKYTGLIFIFLDKGLAATSNILTKDIPYYEFYNPLMKLYIVCYTKNQDICGEKYNDKIEEIDDKLLISFYHTDSPAKIKKTTYKFLCSYQDRFSKYWAKISRMGGAHEQHAKKRRTKQFTKTPLPYTLEFASSTENPHIKNIIADDKLYIENCTKIVF